MMVTTVCPTPEEITIDEFEAALGRYEDVIEAISLSKTAKPGQKTLAELDRYRYKEAPELFTVRRPSRSMQVEDVKLLVEWKLRHGKFRPTLMKLVSSNEASFVEDEIKGAVALYKEKADASATVDALTKLKGIGPATASLLLAVHDPENVIFFADEAFYWLCCHGRREPIKYSAKEYNELNKKSRNLTERLDVQAVDVERVAYVLMNDGGSSIRTTEPSNEKVGKDTSAGKKSGSRPAKRNHDTIVDGAPALRRSKRGKQA